MLSTLLILSAVVITLLAALYLAYQMEKVDQASLSLFLDVKEGIYNASEEIDAIDEFIAKQRTSEGRILDALELRMYIIQDKLSNLKDIYDRQLHKERKR